LTAFQRNVLGCEIRVISLDARVAMAKVHDGAHRGDSMESLVERRKGYIKMLKKLKAELKELEES